MKPPKLKSRLSMKMNLIYKIIQITALFHFPPSSVSLSKSRTRMDYQRTQHIPVIRIRIRIRILLMAKYIYIYRKLSWWLVHRT